MLRKRRAVLGPQDFVGFFCNLSTTHLLSGFYEVNRFIWNQSPCYESPDRYYTKSVPTSNWELCWPHGTGRRRRSWILSSPYLQMVSRSTFSPCPSLIFRTGQVSCLNRQKEAWCVGPVQTEAEEKASCVGRGAEVHLLAHHKLYRAGSVLGPAVGQRAQASREVSNARELGS